MEMILDTNALSALADGDEGLAEKMESVSVPSLPAIVLGEFRYGILGSKHRNRYEGWLKNSLNAFAVVSVDGATAVHYAAIRFGLKSRGQPIPENDLWIAALALQYRLPILSRDRHFRFIPEIRHITW
jgi:tRNA(fMet)-specific endonuclease VapC